MLTGECGIIAVILMLNIVRCGRWKNGTHVLPKIGLATLGFTGRKFTLLLNIRAGLGLRIFVTIDNRVILVLQLFLVYLLIVVILIHKIISAHFVYYSIASA